MLVVSRHILLSSKWLRKYVIIELRTKNFPFVLYEYKTWSFTPVECSVLLFVWTWSIDQYSKNEAATFRELAMLPSTGQNTYSVES
jgi:hypothetical protein